MDPNTIIDIAAATGASLGFAVGAATSYVIARVKIAAFRDTLELRDARIDRLIILNNNLRSQLGRADAYNLELTADADLGKRTREQRAVALAKAAETNARLRAAKAAGNVEPIGKRA